MIFLENNGKISNVYLNKSILDFKHEDGVLYAFDDLDDGFTFYETLVNKINNEIDWMSVRP